LSSEEEVSPAKPYTTTKNSSGVQIKRRTLKVPLVKTKVRRSVRLNVKSQGYKGKACKTSSCYCCSTTPPTLSTKVIRSLGKNICKIKPMALSDKAL
jgi:hypothetical protein